MDTLFSFTPEGLCFDWSNSGLLALATLCLTLMCNGARISIVSALQYRNRTIESRTSSLSRVLSVSLVDVENYKSHNDH